jgi:hypothetical protein
VRRPAIPSMIRRLAIPSLIAVVALLCAGLAGAELSQNGNLRLRFSGRIAPKKLPRTGTAPVTVRVSGAIGTADGQRPPELSKLAIAFNRYGRVSTEGLPVCEAGEIEQTTSKGAREACGGALVGRGKFRANVSLPGRDTFPVSGDMLAFNSSKNGKPAMLLHIYGSNPVQLVFIITFRIVRIDKGTFGTIFVAHIPKIAAELGYVTNVDLTFGRRYEYKGEQRSFLSAKCAAPPGFPGAIFTLARGSFSFDNGQRISSSLARNCWVR